MPHADELILASGDGVIEPAAELFLEEHLRSCGQCRELQRKVERADRLIAAREPGVVVPPASRIAAPRPAGRFLVGAAAVLVVVLGVVAGGALRAFRADEGPSQVAAPGTPSTPALPKDWQLVSVHDLQIPLPPDWRKTIDTIGNSDRPDPASPRILYFEDTSADRAAARIVSIWIWPSRSLDQLVRERYVQGNLSLVSERIVPSARPMREVIGVASWSDAGRTGRYRARHLFVQVDPDRVVDVVVFGPQVPSTETEPTPEMRSIGELVAGHVVALAQQAGCARTRGTDASGVITADGVIGLVGDTYASSSWVDSWLLVRRGAALGDRIGVEFRQLGSSAPASSVSYGVPATLRQTPWGDVAFPFGVKPIGFANSCWRLFVDGSDSGIVLFVGP